MDSSLSCCGVGTGPGRQWELALGDGGNWPSVRDWFWNINARVTWAPGPRVRALSQPGHLALHETAQALRPSA